MNKLGEIEELDVFETENIKSKNIAITIIIIFSVIILFAIAGILFIKEAKRKLSQKTYYVLDINKNNKQTIISMLKDEEIKYCDSITKIEYYNAAHSTFGEIYCDTEENMNLDVEDGSKLIHYIFENGYTVKR